MEQLAQNLNPWLAWLDYQVLPGATVLELLWTAPAALAAWAWWAMYRTSAQLHRDRRRAGRNGARLLYTGMMLRSDRMAAVASSGALLLGLLTLWLPELPVAASPARYLWGHAVGAAFIVGMVYFCYVAVRSLRDRRRIRQLVLQS